MGKFEGRTGLHSNARLALEFEHSDTQAYVVRRKIQW